MELITPYFLTLILTGPVFLLIGHYFKRYPPKKINGIYGYRTRRSRSSQEQWDFSQVYSSERMIESGTVLTLLAFAGLLIDASANPGLHVTIAVALVIGGAFYPVWRTEQELKRRFDRS